MRAAAIFRVAVKQKLRDRLGLALMIFTPPLFVVFYWMFFSNAVPQYDVLFFSNGNSVEIEQLVRSLRSHMAPGDTDRQAPLMRFEDATSEIALLDRLRSGDAHLGVIVEPVVGDEAQASLPVAKVVLAGDISSSRYQISRVMMERGLEAFAADYLERRPLFQVEERPMGISGAKTPFEAYVPGLLVFAVIMLIFSSSMSVVREVEAGTLGRLRMSPVSGLDLLLGLSAPQILLGILSVLFTFATAWVLGFRSQGSLLLSVLVAGLACVASVGIGMVVASLSRSQARSFLLSSAVMFLLVLFSGIVFPRPRIDLVQVGTRTIDLFDLLPTTHMGQALEKILTLGADFNAVMYEISALGIIAVLNFLIGGLLFMGSGRPASTTWEGMP